jgi:excisionase family DNA binding protein
MNSVSCVCNYKAAPERFAYSVDEVAFVAGLGRTTVYQAIQEGTLAARQWRSRTLVLACELAFFLEQLPVGLQRPNQPATANLGADLKATLEPVAYSICEACRITSLGRTSLYLATFLENLPQVSSSRLAAPQPQLQRGRLA